jgi:putative nucleotidyltransferase with HDIG domain
MNPNLDPGSSNFLKRIFQGLFSRTSGDRGWYLYLAAALAVCVAAFLLLGDSGLIRFDNGTEGLEVGKVADKDVIAERDFVYTDEAATRLRVDAERRLVPPVFVVDDRIGIAALSRYKALREGFLRLLSENPPPETFRLRVQREWPDLLSLEEAESIAAYSAPNQIFSHAQQVLASLFERGIVALPETGLEEYNPDTIEIRRWIDGKLEYEQIPANRVPTLRTAVSLSRAALQAKALPRPALESAAMLAERFLEENAFFDPVLSKGRLDAAENSVEPVILTHRAGERVIRKGFIVTETDMERLRVAMVSNRGPNFGLILSGTAFLCFVFFFAVLLLSPPVSGVRLDKNRSCSPWGWWWRISFWRWPCAWCFPGRRRRLGPVSADRPLYHVGGHPPGHAFCRAPDPRSGVLTLLASGFDATAFASAAFSGLLGTFAVRNAEKRIDLIRAGLILGLLQGAAAFVLAGFSSVPTLDALRGVVGHALNGFLCGILTLGFLPLLEQALNAATRFRLMELSDMNAPILKRLLTVAPGTYSHSITVAHLAESACREIGANALLARVGAYYHDIGKIEQPEYFIENQSGGYNKHDKMNPGSRPR